MKKITITGICPEIHSTQSNTEVLYRGFNIIKAIFKYSILKNESLYTQINFSIK